VGFHDGELLVGQFAGFVQNRIRNGNFSHIVQARRRNKPFLVQLLDGIGIYPPLRQRIKQYLYVRGCPLYMAARFLVAAFQ
jgi:hypothetical protein